MSYTAHSIRKVKSFSLFVSTAIWVLFAYYKLAEFIEAAISLNYLNVQTVSFIVYSILLMFLPATAIFSPRSVRKRILMWICFCLSVVILVGAIGDLFTYNFFRNYTFFSGDPIFCNIILGIPNLCGTFCCLLISVLYFLLGINIMENRSVACVLYLFIFLIGSVFPFSYYYILLRSFPRDAWMSKAAFFIPHQLFLLFSFISAYILEIFRKKYLEYELTLDSESDSEL